MKVEERLFSVEDTAERLGVSKWTITDWIKAGRLKGIKIGKFWRVRESDLEAFIANPPPLKRVSLAVPQARPRPRTAPPRRRHPRRRCARQPCCPACRRCTPRV